MYPVRNQPNFIVILLWFCGGMFLLATGLWPFAILLFVIVMVFVQVFPILTRITYALRNIFSNISCLIKLIPAKCYRSIFLPLLAKLPQNSLLLNRKHAEQTEARYDECSDQNSLNQSVHSWKKVPGSTALSRLALLFHLGILNNSCGTILRRFQARGDIKDLNRVDRLSHEMIKLTPPGYTELPIYLNTRGNVLATRYSITGIIQDLNEAISIHQAALHANQNGSLPRPACLNNLGTALLARFDFQANRNDLDQAIKCFEDAVKLSGPSSPYLSGSLNNLGIAFEKRFASNQNRNIADLYGATQAYNKAIANTPRRSQCLPKYWHNLGGALKSLSSHPTGTGQHLDQAIKAFRQAADLYPANSPERGATLICLADTLRSKHDLFKTINDLNSAVEAYRLAIKIGKNAAYVEVLSAALKWGDWMFELKMWNEAVEAYKNAVEASDKLVHLQYIRSLKEVWLRGIQRLFSRYAFVLTKQESLSKTTFLEAIFSFEKGHARLMTEELEIQGHLNALRKSNTDLFERYHKTTKRLEQFFASTRDWRTESALHIRFDFASTLRSDLEKVIQEIRALPSFEGFLSSPTLNEVQSALTTLHNSEAVLYLDVTTHGALALIATPYTCKIIRNDHFTEEKLDRIIKQLVGDQDASSLQRNLKPLMSRIGKGIMNQVAKDLHELGIGHVFIIPAGRLALLPLHAAYCTIAKNSFYFTDEFTVSYAQNLRALSIADSKVKRQTATEPYLVGIGNPLPSPCSIPSAELELKNISTLFSNEHQHTFYREDATRVNLLRTIGRGNYLHFACHAIFEPEASLRSRLCLSGKDSLSLDDLITEKVRPVNARLAVLSACRSAVNDYRTLPGEFVGLPAGFMQAGIPGVLGTLWEVEGVSTALLVMKFYEFHLSGENLPPSQSLQQAQQWLRGLTVRDESRALMQLYGFGGNNVMQFDRDSDSDSTSRPFSNPYYWAGFVFYGV
jgi:CHAT domain-containing protein